MNLLGKIFVGLILVSSLVFMGFAVAVYSTHKNWKLTVDNEQVGPDRPLGLKQQLAEAKAKNEELQNQYSKLLEAVASERSSKDQLIAKLESDLAAEKKELDDLRNEQALLKQGERQAVAATAEAQKMLNDKLAVIDALRAEIVKAHEDRDNHFKQVVAVTDSLHEAQGELERAKAQQVVLAELVAKGKVRLERLGMTFDTPIEGVPPKVDGVVLASSANGLVEISIGADEGLAKGHTLIVYRLHGGESKYLGKIEVLRTWPDRSVAKVIPESRKGPIEKEDRVATRLN